MAALYRDTEDLARSRPGHSAVTTRAANGTAAIRPAPGGRGRLVVEDAMAGMKITLDAAMRVRDVSRPRPDHEAAAQAQSASPPAQSAPAQPTSGPAPSAPAQSAAAQARPGPARAAAARAAPAALPDRTRQAVAQRNPSAPAGSRSPAASPPAPAPATPAGPTGRGRRGAPAASSPGTDTSGTGNRNTTSDAGTRGTGGNTRGSRGKRHRSRRRFPR